MIAFQHQLFFKIIVTYLYVVFFDQINMFKSMFSLYLNYTINASPPFNATPPFKLLENRL